MSDVFDFETYKEFLTTLVRAGGSERGYQARLARAAGCQPSYLSQVLTGKAELSQDQLIGIADFLGLNERESAYLIHLLGRSRAGTPQARRFFDGQLSKMRKAHARLSDRVATPEVHSGTLETIYYSSWLFAAVHVATSVPGQTALSLSEAFGVSFSEIARTLKLLESFGLVRSDGERWLYLAGAAHLPEESWMTDVNHMHWRQRSVAKLSARNHDDIRYTSAFTISHADAEILREAILKTIADWRKLIGPSPAELTMALTCDFFAV